MNKEKFRISGLKKVLLTAIVLAAAFLLAPAVRAADQPPFLYLPVECEWWNRCPIPAPTILSPQTGSEFKTGPLTVQGLTWNNTKVDIFLDNELVGRPLVKNNPGADITSFGFKLNYLTPGVHRLYAVAYSLNGWERSPDSYHFDFLVVSPYPAPVLIQPLVYNSTGELVLRGFVRNHSVLEITFNKEPLPQVIVDNSGNQPTVHFVVALPPTEVGLHQVTAAALDSVTGKKSQMISAELRFIGTRAELSESTVIKIPLKSITNQQVRGATTVGKSLEQNTITNWQPPQTDMVQSPTISLLRQIRLIGLILFSACLLAGVFIIRDIKVS